MSTIGPISSSVGSAHAQVLKRAQEALQTEKPSQAFGDRITNAIDQVAEAQNNTAKLVKAYEMGMENDISKVMINQQVSSLGFQLTLNVRNKVLSAYKDIMNMPV
ncbi:MAG: flagellar hook-basal body complex protein FliE [Candidatus Puniceispirillaceae bacterium]|jgi:flagellar hook-basal body complex protein FliE